MRHYMMATTAMHQMGDVSREEPDLCVVDTEDGDNHRGSWVFGFGLADVLFPKSTTRELTPEERERYNGKTVTMNGQPVYQLLLT